MTWLAALTKARDRGLRGDKVPTTLERSAKKPIQPHFRLSSRKCKISPFHTPDYFFLFVGTSQTIPAFGTLVSRLIREPINWQLIGCEILVTVTMVSKDFSNR